MSRLFRKVLSFPVAFGAIVLASLGKGTGKVLEVVLTSSENSSAKVSVVQRMGASVCLQSAS